jgi:hypothetical protein
VKTSGKHVAAGEGQVKRQLAKRSGRPFGQRVGRGLASVIWPQRSLITHRELAGPGALEPALWAKLQFLSEPLCALRHGVRDRRGTGAGLRRLYRKTAGL